MLWSAPKYNVPFLVWFGHVLHSCNFCQGRRAHVSLIIRTTKTFFYEVTFEHWFEPQCVHASSEPPWWVLMQTKTTSLTSSRTSCLLHTRVHWFKFTPTQKVLFGLDPTRQSGCELGLQNIHSSLPSCSNISLWKPGVNNPAA